MAAPTGGIAALTLVLGDEELLVERAVSRVVAAIRGSDAEAEVVDRPAAGLGPGELPVLLSPSLFGAYRVVVLRDAHELAKDPAAELLHDLQGATEDRTAAVVVTHNGGAKARALVDGLAAVAAVVRCERLATVGMRIDFVMAEAGAAGGRMSGDAAAALVSAVGADLRELAAATAQLVADSGGEVDEPTVARYHRGRADASGFAVADRAVAGDVRGAVEVLRWALSVGVAPVLVTSSLAANLRLVAKVAAEGRVSPARAAKTLGQPAWKVERAMRWARGWSPPALAGALRAVAAADADVKGAAADAGYAVERAVLAVAHGRAG